MKKKSHGLFLAIVIGAVLATILFITFYHEPKDETPENTNEPSMEQEASKEEDQQEEPEIKQEPEEPTKPAVDLNDEYLILANKTHDLPADYEPDDLTAIKHHAGGQNNKLRAAAAEAIDKLFERAQDEGYNIQSISAYRTYSYQQNLFNNYVKKHGEEEAVKFSARPGQSEHQTGLACDVSSPCVGWDLKYSYGDTEEGKWLAEHAHEYGFIIRYFDGTSTETGAITGYLYEPWHIRYVGVEHATAIFEQGITLEEYLGQTD